MGLLTEEESLPESSVELVLIGMLLQQSAALSNYAAHGFGDFVRNKGTDIDHLLVLLLAEHSLCHASPND